MLFRLGGVGTLWNDFVDSLVSSKRFADCRYCGGTFSRLSVNPTFPSLSVHRYVSAAAGSGRSSPRQAARDRKSTRLNSSHLVISYAVFCLKKKKMSQHRQS